VAKRKTARQIAASRRNIKKAQAASARKRRGRGRGSSRRRKVAAVAATGVALGTGALVARHRISGSKIHIRGEASRTPRFGDRVKTEQLFDYRGFRAGKKHTRLPGTGGQPMSKTGFRRMGLTAVHISRKGDMDIKRGYVHKKMDVKGTANVLGKKISGAPRDVINRRPANAFERRRMRKFNVPMTPDQKARSSVGTKGIFYSPSAYAGRKIEGDEVQRRANAYVRSRNTRTRRANATAKIKHPLARHAARTVVGGTYGPRLSGAKQSRMHARAVKYYSQQPRYTPYGTVGRRGRKRSRELRRKKK
jgi:hypothetical protein